MEKKKVNIFIFLSTITKFLRKTIKYLTKLFWINTLNPRVDSLLLILEGLKREHRITFETIITQLLPIIRLCQISVLFVKYLMDKKRRWIQRKSCTKARIKETKVEGTRAETA